MRSWEWSSEDAWSLGLAADVRFGPTDYSDDQIWEIQLRRAEPPGLAAATSYGGRIRGVHIVPSFAQEGRAVVDPGDYHRPPIVQQALPNYARLAFSPLSGMEAVAEYWVLDSHRLVSRLDLLATSEHSLTIDLRLNVQLLPGSDADPMLPVTYHGAVALQGRIGDLQPVVFLSGGAVALRAVTPGLHVSASLAPGERRSWTWSHAGMVDPNQGFEAARSATQLPLDALAARIERMAESIVQVETGRPEWDAAFHLSQVAALSSFVGPTRHLPSPSPVLRRGPVDGHSARGDGADHDWRWSGQELLSAGYLARQVLPAAPELAQGIVRNALATQGADGAVDGKPGLAGQRLRIAAPPMLAELVWQIYRQTEDVDFVAAVLPGLVESFESWFDASRDRDQDGFPEWDHPLQPGYPTHPVFCRTDAACQGADLRQVESPDLVALLMRESEALARLAQIAGTLRGLASVEGRRRRLLEGLSRCWDSGSEVYRRVDSNLHTTPQPVTIASIEGSGRVDPGIALRYPARLVVRVMGNESDGRSLEIVLTGRPAAGRERSLRIGAEDLSWFWQTGCATTPQAFASLSRVQVRGAADDVQTMILVPDLGRVDLAMLLPLWAEAPEPEVAEALLESQLLRPERFWRPHGLPFLPASDKDYPAQQAGGEAGVSMIWNAMLGEALLAYSRQEQAAALLDRLVGDIVTSLRDQHTLRQGYHPESGAGQGDRHAACGGAPLSLLLECVGVRLVSPTKVGLSGRNVLDGAVTLSWRGLRVTRNGDVTRVVFPDGQAIDTQGEEPLEIEQQPRHPAGGEIGGRSALHRPGGVAGGGS